MPDQEGKPSTFLRVCREGKVEVLTAYSLVRGIESKKVLMPNYLYSWTAGVTRAGIPLGGRGDITAESWDRLRWDRARMVRSRTPFERETEGSRDEEAGDGGLGGEVA